MRGDRLRPIVIAAGGTGGHVFPAEALASVLIARNHRVVLMTDERSGARMSPIFEGGEHHILSGSGIAGRGVRRGARAVFELSRGVLQARALLARLEAAAVVGFGGYPSVPPIIGAALLRRRPKILLHEQNAVLGRANRMLARFADRLAMGFEATTRVPAGVQTVTTGNPIRPAIAELRDLSYAAPQGRINLLIIGGSLGARIFSDVVPDAIAALSPELRARINITQQCRMEDLQRVRASYRVSGVTYDLNPFFPDIATKLAGAHLVISRAGASSTAEFAVAGRPSILVPLPGAIDDHQRANAHALQNAGGAWIIPQHDFSSAALASMLADKLNNPVKLATAAEAARRIAKPDAAERLADIVETMIAETTITPAEALR